MYLDDRQADCLCWLLTGKIETCRPCLRGSSRLACKRRSGWFVVVVGGGGGCATICVVCGVGLRSPRLEIRESWILAIAVAQNGHEAELHWLFKVVSECFRYSFLIASLLGFEGCVYS